MATVLLLLVCSAARAGLGPENVAVVVNEDSWASKAVANEFIGLRGVPPCNVVYLKDLPSFGYADVDFLRRHILQPVLATLTARGVSGQIDCIAYAPDIPHTIDTSRDFAVPPPPQVGTRASLTGLTYLYMHTLAGQGRYAGPHTNTYFRRLLPPVKQPDLTEAQMRTIDEVRRLIRRAAWDEAEAHAAALAKECPQSAQTQDFLALCLAHRGAHDEALQALQRAADAGWLNWRSWQTEKAFAPLRVRPEFQALVERVRALRLDSAPTHGFRNAYGWSAEGERVGPERGARFLLSVMLGATSGRGNSVPEALDCLRRAAAADASRPSGTFYFMQNDDIRSRTRDWLFPSVVEALRALGMRAEALDGIVPSQRDDVAGVVIGAAEFDWRASGSTILPGAICEHFTSCGGMLGPKDGQTPLTNLILRGAAGASGAVVEPYAILDKFPSPFIHLHYARGSTLAEAFYQSVARPYQLLIVGDPLCAPWVRRPTISVRGIAPGDVVKGRIELSTEVAKDGVAVQSIELFVDGVRRAATKPGEIIRADAAQLPDGFHEFRLVAVADTPLEERAGLSLPVRIEHTGRQVTLTGPKTLAWVWDQPLMIHASMPGAAVLRLYHNSREIGSIAGEAGTIAIDPLHLGQGICRLQCVAFDGQNRPLAVSAFLTVEVVPPKPLPAFDPPPGAASEKGLLLTPAGSAGVPVPDIEDDRWLSKYGVKEGQAFALDAIFDATEEGVHQFQVKGNVRPSLEVDGVALGHTEADRWVTWPVALAKGRHRLRLTGQAAKDPALDIRVGYRGARRPAAPAFRHLPAAGPAATP